MNEERAIKLCVERRDPIGFEFLVKKYQREAYLHALAFLGDREEALEACQESFASAFANLPRVRELAVFYPWFYRVLKNHCLNILCRRRTAASYARTERGGEEETFSNPEELVSGGEDRAQVWEVLAELKLEFREILALKYIRSYDYETLAAILRIPRGTVMSRLYHARKAFQTAYLAKREGVPKSKEVRSHE
jgi:RNA polymerase sigma-70 factor (ECF subfamily)